MKKSIFFVLALLQCQILFAVEKSGLERKLDLTLRNKQLNSCDISYIVTNPSNGEILASKNHHNLMNPASVNKVLISAAALKELGPDYRFHTQFITDGDINHGEINNLWIKGDGDPFLVIENLWSAIRMLRNRGVEKIKGNVFIDNTYFDNFTYPGYNDNNQRAYNSLVSPLALNFNSVTIIVSPSDETGLPAHVVVDPKNQYINLINKATTGSKNTISIDKLSSEVGDTIIVKGNIAKGSEPIEVYRNISKPDEYFGFTFKELLRQNNIYLLGIVKNGASPQGGKIIVDYPSKPLSLLIRDMNKFSNNFVAEQILKHLGAVEYGEPGSTEKGIHAIKSWMNKIGVKDNFYIENASGLSQKNKISSYEIAQVLIAAYNDFSIQPEFLSSLSIAGVDGTIRSRHKEDSVLGKMRAKTGSLTGVSSLAGFIPDSKNNILSFVIIMNECGANWDVLHNSQSNFVETLTKN